MSIPSVDVLLESGVHFGHQTSRWNPKMKEYIFGRKNLIHIIDLRATLKGLVRASNLVKNIAARGEFILIVGTKRQARSVVLEEAQRSGMPYVADRWLGGTLTNFLTIRSRLKRLNELEEMEESGTINFYSKKEVSRFRRELQKLHRNLGGIREMPKLPGVLVVIDPSKEGIAVKEARKLEIPVVGLVDTDTDPELVDIVIPCNDDAFRSIKIILSLLSESVLEGKAIWEEKRDIVQKTQERERSAARPPARKRSGRRDSRPPRRRSSPPRAKAAPKESESKPASKETKPAPKESKPASKEAKPADTPAAGQPEEKPQPDTEEKKESKETAQEAGNETQTS